ncbi:MAG: DUF2341 domain-containing protein [Acidobacteriia bacterium]|nr:DUF2341 domain-containing protein [Terriglobia bacterium]
MPRLNIKNYRSKIAFRLKFFFVAFYYAFRYPRKFWNALSVRGKKLALRGLIILLIILIAVPVSFWYSAKTAKAAWWNENWMYRIAIPVTNNTTQETNVYISFSVDTRDTSKFQADCGDIRFTKLNGEILPYYLASACGLINTTIHVNFNVFPAGAQTIYMYYGNPSAPNGFSASDFATQASNYTVGTFGAEEKGPGPLAYWKFDEGQGTTAYNSTSTTGIDGTLQNSPTWKSESDCVGGKCLEYNGTTNYVSVNDSGTALDFVSANQYTWSAWINYSGFPAGQTKQCFLSKDGPPGAQQKTTGFNLCLNQTSSTADPIICKGDAASGLSCSTGLSLGLAANTWMHIEMEYDGASNWKTYVNGNYKGSQSLAVTSDTTYKYFVGAGNATTSSSIQVPAYFFKGKIDSVKIFPYQRSADQVKQDFNSGKAGGDSSEGTSVSVGGTPKWMTDGLVGWWKMDESSGTAVADSSGNGNTGTLTNAQETGTAQTGSNTTSITDPANASLSSTDDSYNGMILQITSGGMNGTQRTIADYTGASKTFTFAALSGDPTGATFIILHQTGGKFGNGLGFFGDDYSETSSNVTIGSRNVSMFIWAKPTSLNDYVKAFSYSGEEASIYCYSSLGCMALMRNASGDQKYTSAYTLPQNTYTNLGFVYDDSNYKLSFYVNGQLHSSTIVDGGARLNPGKIYIGSGNSGDVFNGFLDEARLYNRALSPDEVRKLSEWAPGPVGWWKMDEKVSGNGQTLADSSGYGNNGTTDDGANNTGMDCTVQGKYGGGCQFDGTDDSVNMSDPASGDLDVGTGDFTIETWFYSNNAEANQALFSKGSVDGSCTVDGNQGYQLYFYQSFYQKILFKVNTGSAQDCQTLVGNTSLSSLSNAWHHVSITADRDGNATLYLDGKPDGTASLSSFTNSLNNSSNLIIGATSNPTYLPFNGKIDQVKIYKYLRTPKEIIEDINAGHPAPGSPVGSPVGYWKLDDGYGSSSQDSSQNNQDLTLVSTPVWTNSGKFGRALDFERDNAQYSWTADSPALSITSDLTLSAWIKPESNDAGADFVIAGKWTTASGQSYLLEQYGSELRMYIDSSSNYKTTSGLGLQTGQWYYVAGVYSATAQTVTLYVNGVDKGGSVTGTIPSSIGDSSENFFIGSYSGMGATRAYDGLIDEAKVYNSALAPNQIALDMNQGKELELGSPQSAAGETGQAAAYCVPGDATSCAGPVGEWKFEENTGSSTNDTSGNGSTGTLYSNPTWTTGKIGSGLNFNGNSCVYLGNPAILQFQSTNEITVSAWVKLNSTVSSNYAPIYDSLDDSWATGGVRLYIDTSNRLAAYSRTNNFYENASFPVGSWQFVTLRVIEGTGAYLYRNGQLVASGSAGDIYSNVYQRIGNRSGNEANQCTGATQFFPGIIDNVSVYGYARTSAQIAWDYNRGMPIGWWKMDDGEGSTVRDSSGNGNTGTLTSMDPPNDWVTGKFNTALDFDGSNDYVSIPDSGTTLDFDSTKQYSWSAWIKWTNFAKTTQCYFSKDPFSLAKTTGFNLCLNQTSSTADPIICKGSSGVVGNLDCSTGLNLNLPSDSWINLSVVYDGAGNWKIYENGEYMGTETLSVSSDTTVPYLIGVGNAKTNGGNPVPDYFFTGQIDDVRVYNYALTADQVKQVMNEGSQIRFGQ